MTSGAESWTALDPFEKARRWVKVSPQIADMLIRQAATHADQMLQLESEKQHHEMKLAELNSQHTRELANLNAQHVREMDVRRWRTQLVGTLGGLLCILCLIGVAWVYAESGNVVPAVTIFALGTGLTAGVYGVQRSISNDSRTLMQEFQKLIEESQPPNDESGTSAN
jgi:hypothetical protein